MKPTGKAVAARAVELVTGARIGYDELDCQAFVERCVNDCGGSMAYAGSNDMARNAVVWMGTIANAKAAGKLVPGAGLMIHDDDENGLPAKYRGDGLGDFSHVGLYVGENALTDTDKNGKARSCDVVHSSSSMGRVAGSTIANGWTHVVWFGEIDYGAEANPGVTLGAAVEPQNSPAEAGDDAGGENAQAANSVRYAVVYASNGAPVKLRPQRERGKLYWNVACGTRVAVERTRDGWALIRALCTDGAERRAWMMDQFLRYEG